MSQEKSAPLVSSTFQDKTHELKIFMDGVSQWFLTHPHLSQGNPPIVHSVKSRLKNLDHLEEKVRRKTREGPAITEDNLFERITDLAGVRVLHLYQEQFRLIHKEILVKVEKQQDWHLHEPPKAYTWDPESKADSPICCEVQVRTLFEEVWGEVDHVLNYPQPSPDLSCREQLLVLAKLVGAGTRLVDSIFRSVKDPSR